MTALEVLEVLKDYLNNNEHKCVNVNEIITKIENDLKNNKSIEEIKEHINRKPSLKEVRASVFKHSNFISA